VNTTPDSIVLLPDEKYLYGLLGRIRHASSRIWACIFIVDITMATDRNYLVRTVFGELRSAVDRGVDVRLLVGRSENIFIEQANRASYRFARVLGIPARLYGGEPRTLHAKYVVIDDDVLLGSHNWENLAFERGLAREDSVLVRSASVRDLIVPRFERLWKHASEPGVSLPTGAPLSEITRQHKVRAADRQVAASPGECSVVLDGKYPRSVGQLIRDARKRLDVAMFFMTGTGKGGGAKLLVDALVDARKRGVDVRVLLDKDRQGDVYGSAMINARVARYLDAQKVGVRFDATDRLLHSKFLVVDDSITVIGSHNWTRAAFENYHEATVVVHSKPATTRQRARFARLWDDGTSELAVTVPD
jgi:phosphatidylserine/phosphatidylglycerophosphate/cardiolipin synthase-like enzyme